MLFSVFLFLCLNFDEGIEKSVNTMLRPEFATCKAKKGARRRLLFRLNTRETVKNKGEISLKNMYLRLSPYMKNVNRGFNGFQLGAAVEFWRDIDVKSLQDQRKIGIVNICEAVQVPR